MLFDELEDELQLFPADWLADFIDSSVCGILAGVFDQVLGKELIRGIMKKDWEHQGGIKKVCAHCADGYMFFLTVAALCNFIYVIVVSKPHLALNLCGKFLTTVIIKCAVVETFILTFKTWNACRK